MQFAKDFPDELRMQIRTSDVVSKKVALKHKGKEHSGLCPFHNEKTPSFTVNDQKGFYHCFGCGAHGDIISFVMNTQGLDFKEAVLQLANDHNIPVPVIKIENQKNEDARLNKIKKEFEILDKISQFFEQNLFDYAGQNALNYLQKRGLDIKNIKKFRLGFAPDSYDKLHSFLTKSGFTEKELLESAAIGKNQRGKLYDKFRNRVIFPILDKKNRVIAYGGRILGDGQPKYLNSSETNLFKKGSNLYNFSFARKAIYENKYAVVVEGYMDVLALSINGIENAVAPLGTAITINQLEELFKITNDIVICLDGDQAGINAMNRTIDLALPIINSGKTLRFALLPANTDPDDFIKQNGAKAAKNLLDNAKSLSETLFEFESKKIGISDLENKIAPEKKAVLEDILMKKVELIADFNTKKYFTQYYRNLLYEIGRKKFQKPKNIQKSPEITLQKSNPLLLIEASILVILIQDPKLIDYQDNYCNMRDFDFQDENLSNIKESLIDYIEEKNDYNSYDLLDFLNQILIDQTLKSRILRKNKNSISNEIILKILALKHHHHKVCEQYKEILSKVDDFDTNESSIKSGKQRELFNHKTQLEKEILELESNLT